MEEIIDKLGNVSKLIDVLEDNDKINFKSEADNFLTRINTIIDEMKTKLSSLNVSKQKCAELDLQNNKDKIICQGLFPYYWTINEQLREIFNERLAPTFGSGG